MTSANVTVLERIEKVARALGPDRDRLVFVGSAAIALYATRHPAEIRPTNDVDVVGALSLTDYQTLVARLRARGFRPCRDEGAPACRYELDGILVDVLTDDPQVLGFTNRWYREGLANAEDWTLPGGLAVRALRPADFVATKLEAFDSRGNEDYLASTDLEDVVTMLVAVPELADPLSKPRTEAERHMRRRLAELTAKGRLLESLTNHLPGTAAGEAAALALARRLRALAEAETSKADADP